MPKRILIVLSLALSWPPAWDTLPGRVSGGEPSAADRVDKLVRQLGADEFTVREAASRELVQMGRPALPALRQALQSKDGEVRRRARQLLDTIQASVPVLVQDLKDKDPAVRKEAAELLERLGAQARSAVPALVEGLKDADEAAREAAIMALLAVDADHPALANTTPRKASVNGKYGKLLRRLNMPQDRQQYGDFREYGSWGGNAYGGYTNLPPGYWVYVHPNWYIWGEVRQAP